ncbi:hypothetical protein FF100_19910 [Methylobacterium terricola]|uniref:Uncharacterized protein n=1 Tax=Methylobacterium terricola TaxID=2583531 RepID=A0A5C4LGD6_9HYPH|nr:hypothetical protein [Methylobacterium terricola]TNC11391.1 hypothetical protein FF100_19910 [Methylobacterium terricola]
MKTVRPHDIRTEVLPGETESRKDKLDLVAQSIAFARGLRERAGPDSRPVTNAFLDGLYEDP